MCKKLYILFLSAFLFVSGLPATAQTVSNVRAGRNGDDVMVTYLLGSPADSVQLFVSIDGGKTFSHSLRMISGTVRDIPSGYHSLVWDVQSEFGELVGDEIVFKLTAYSKKNASLSGSSAHKTSRTRVLLEANLISNSEMFWGVTLGFVKKAGLYARYMQSMEYSNSKYCGGLIFNIGNVLYPYAGAGYGVEHDNGREDNGRIRSASDVSVSGWAFDAGLKLRLGFISLSVGAFTNNFESADVVFGVGFMF